MVKLRKVNKERRSLTGWSSYQPNSPDRSIEREPRYRPNGADSYNQNSYHRRWSVRSYALVQIRHFGGFARELRYKRTGRYFTEWDIRCGERYPTYFRLSRQIAFSEYFSPAPPWVELVEVVNGMFNAMDVPEWLIHR